MTGIFASFMLAGSIAGLCTPAFVHITKPPPRFWCRGMALDVLIMLMSFVKCVCGLGFRHGFDLDFPLLIAILSVRIQVQFGV